eukprot:14918599-Alexandrium_andersonii.AAC.1
MPLEGEMGAAGADGPGRAARDPAQPSGEERRRRECAHLPFQVMVCSWRVRVRAERTARECPPRGSRCPRGCNGLGLPRKGRLGRASHRP